MNEIITKNDTKIENMIYEIRGVQVMLDSDLARLYQCKNGTKMINLAVKRNIERFPENFYFKLTREEYYQILRFQFETLEFEQGKYSKYEPYAFTEQGVAMLASVLRTPIAAKTSISIMNAFVVMRKYIGSNLLEQKYINNQVIKNTEDIKALQESFDKLNEKTKTNTLFFEGQIYDAFSLLIDILNKATSEIIIIDNFAGKELLDILKNINVSIKIVSCNIDETLKKKYESQYSNVTFIYNNTIHDRFIILDKSVLYTCGASFKDLGKKCFCISKIDNIEILEQIINKIES